MTSSQESHESRESAAEAARRVAEASRRATEELHKQGTPEYDPRQHAKSVERAHRAVDARDA